MLPLLAGIVVGAGAVIAYNNKEELKAKIADGASTVKEKATKAKDTVAKKVKPATSKKVDKTEKKDIEVSDDTSK